MLCSVGQRLVSSFSQVGLDVATEETVSIPVEIVARKVWKLYTKPLGCKVDSFLYFHRVGNSVGVELKRMQAQTFCSLLAAESMQTGVELLELRRNPTKLVAASDIAKHALMLVPACLMKHVVVGPLPDVLLPGSCVLPRTFEIDGSMTSITLNPCPPHWPDSQKDDKKKATQPMLVPFWLTPCVDTDFNMEWCEVPLRAS